MSQTYEPLLNLALQTPESQRVRTQQLNVGYDTLSQTWEFIIKYHGALSFPPLSGIKVEELIAGYAILTVPEGQVGSLSFYPQIEYIEKPKRYYFSLHSSPTVFSQTDFLESSCIDQLTGQVPFLSGKGVLLAVIDSGLSYERPEFRHPDGSTRIAFLWDQTALEGPPPEGFAVGREYTEADINEALASSVFFPDSIDSSGHGTAVTGIAAASPTAEGYLGVAPECTLLIVKLGLPKENGFPRTTEIMRAVTYVIRKSLERNMPLVINLSFGNTYGSHDGSSLLERFLDNAAEIGKTVICTGNGNEGSTSGHTTGLLSPEEGGERTLELAIGSFESNLSIQIWSHYSDRYLLFLRSPSGETVRLPVTETSGKYVFTLDQTTILLYLGEPSPYSVSRECYLEFLSAEASFLPSGIWTFRTVTLRSVVGSLYFYLPSAAARSPQTGFLTPTTQVTLTIPSTASRLISVGAYDPAYDAFADFSGRGYENSSRSIGVVTAGLIKPDLAAPGVNLPAPALYGGYTTVTGTSFATPVVSGTAVLMMEWGIVRGNDPYLYGEKIKAYLRSGARPIRGITEYPNNRVGFGALCAFLSLPLK